MLPIIGHGIGGGTWIPLANQPTFQPGTMLLLTDGTVMCQQSGTNKWWRLTPDINGSYLGGTWSKFADSPHGPTYYASAVLRDGRVFFAGGEFDSFDDSGLSAGVEARAADLDLAWIFDPRANSWAQIPTPGWGAIGDAVSCMFPDGRILLGSILGPQCAIYDPVTNGWSPAASKHNATTNEETWTLLPDQTILTCDCAGAPQTEKYLIASNQWVVCGNTPQNLVETGPEIGEIGPAILLADGRLFAIGATGATALYTVPPLSSQPGTWAGGPAFPPQNGKRIGAKDAPAVLLPNGKVLCAVGPVNGDQGAYFPPTFFFEFDPATNTLSPVNAPPNAAAAPYKGRLLLLPTGQVLFGSADFAAIEVYTPFGGPDPAWKPTITGSWTHLIRGFTYTLMGRQLNGLSQANSYGDDAQMATNYPLVRLVYPATGHTYYCRTFNHSTMGVHTGSVVQSTEFSIPPGVPTGAANLQVVANGIASDPLAVALADLGEVPREVVELAAEIEKIEFVDVVKRPHA